MIAVDRRTQLTFKGNRGVARHGWVRLTPAYGVRLVEQELSKRPDARVVLDPFSGTGTTGLCASTAGRRAHLVDLNPFLIWLASAKTKSYTDDDAMKGVALANRIADDAAAQWRDPSLWQPALSNISRWWSPSALAALKALRAACDSQISDDSGAWCDLVMIAFCQTLISWSSAAFNHQSMSFKNGLHPDLPADHSDVVRVIDDFRVRALNVVEECEPNPPGTVAVHLGEARSLGASVTEPVDLLVTSPPYCNRMSYIRELRPYMYWLRFLGQASEASELDWKTIGGTWGVATSRLMTEDLGDPPPLNGAFLATVKAISETQGERNARLLSNYVFKYFADVWKHVRATTEVMADAGQLTYIVGNSTFFGHLVPTEDWYAELLSTAGYVNVKVEPIRKRNSNKLLYEFAVTAEKASA